MQLDGKAALVTGAGTGVGRATSLQLAAAGCRVVVNYCRSQDAAESVVQEIAGLGGESIARQGDVASDGDARRLVQAAVDQFGRLDILINNAATTDFIPFAELDRVTDEVWQRIMSVNVVGAFHCARAATRAMRDTAGTDGAEIVNISSVAGLLSTGSCIPYSVSKAALNHLTVTLSRTLAPKIRVNAVAPGFIDTDWGRKGLGARYEQVKQAFADAMPLQAVCTADDVAVAIVSIITGSDLVTGQIIPCDGGMTIMSPVSV